LGLKKRGFGQGKLVGLGGKVEPGEALAAAAVRELYEEAGLWVDSDRLDAVARLTFLFPARPDWDHRMHVFIARAWQGELLESNEIEPQWHAIDALPFDRMWDDGRYWLPQALAGQRLAATFVYGEDLETVVAFEQSDANQCRFDQDDAEICVDHENLRPDPPKSRDTLRLTLDT
jgi:8-oxo-dGTP diphosphatase